MNYKMKQNFENGESTEGGMVCLGRNICRFRFYCSTERSLKKDMVGRPRLERGTNGLKVHCSTN